jgi:hypothetical protein
VTLLPSLKRRSAESCINGCVESVSKVRIKARKQAHIGKRSDVVHECNQTKTNSMTWQLGKYVQIEGVIKAYRSHQGTWLAGA